MGQVPRRASAVAELGVVRRISRILIFFFHRILVMATDVDRNIEGAKALYSGYPLARLRALLPTRVNSPTEYTHSALLELISEREQELAAAVARTAGRRAVAAIVVSLLALVVAAWTLWLRVGELSARSPGASPAGILSQTAAPPLLPDSSPGQPALSSPLASDDPATGTSTTSPTQSPPSPKQTP